MYQVPQYEQSKQPTALYVARATLLVVPIWHDLLKVSQHPQFAISWSNSSDVNQRTRRRRRRQQQQRQRCSRALHPRERPAVAAQGAFRPGVPERRSHGDGEGGSCGRYVGQCAAHHPVCTEAFNIQWWAGNFSMENRNVFPRLPSCEDTNLRDTLNSRQTSSSACQGVQAPWVRNHVFWRLT